MADFISVPFYELFHETSHVPRIRRDLPPLLAGVRRSILEVGAGSGLVTTSLADCTPGEVFALEPSAAMRGVLMSRLTARPELLSRVTVLPCDALSLRLDEPAEAAVMINVMYALEPDYRRQFWPVLAKSLEPGGLFVLTWRDGSPPEPHPLREMESRRVGRHTYSALVELLGRDGEARHMRYVHRITEGDTVIMEEELTGCGYRPDRETLWRELEDAGFTLADVPVPDGLLAWRRR